MRALNVNELKGVKEEVTLTNRDHFCSLAILYFYILSLIPIENLSIILISIVAEPQHFFDLVIV